MFQNRFVEKSETCFLRSCGFRNNFIKVIYLIS
jgi:hypothetical protein